MQNHYEIIDNSTRQQQSVEAITDYAVDPHLAEEHDIVLLVKWDDQRQRDDGIREFARQHPLHSTRTEAGPGPRRQLGYFGGYIVRASLAQDSLTIDTTVSEPVVRPMGMDVAADGRTVYALGNELRLRAAPESGLLSQTFWQPQFARLHSAVFDERQKRLLTSSASLDMLYEIDCVSGKVAWSMDLWEETPFNTNDRGQSFFRKPVKAEGDYVMNPSSAALENDPTLVAAACVIDDPEAYDRLGLKTALVPVFINSIDYENDRTLLATSYGRGEAWRIHRDSGQIEVVAKNLARPHGFHKKDSDGGYLVSDTRNERVLFLDEDFKREHVVDLSDAEYRKPGLENHKWLQYTSELADNTYCAVMSSRQTLILFNPVERVRRTVRFDPDWGVQTVFAAQSLPH